MKNSYPNYKGLPHLAGVCSMDEAMKPGLGVEESVHRLKRHHYSLKRLHHILAVRITSEPIYELKTAFSLHAHLCAEHVTAIRSRVGEMREPPLGLDEIPDPALEVLFDEILCAPTTEHLLWGLYGRALPDLIESMERHSKEVHPLADHPTLRVLRFALMELREILDFGQAALKALEVERPEEWDSLLVDLSLLPSSDVGKLRRYYSQTPYQYDPVPKRDERFQDSYNGGVNAEAFLYTPEFPDNAKTLMMYYKRIRELDVPEMMASLIAEMGNKPWEFYRDMTRQLWDEARHAIMGEVGFNRLGLDWTSIPINFTWSLNLNTQLTPTERHAVLFFIEQGLMKKTGKRYEWEVSESAGDPLATTFQDFDWADEVLHAVIGRRWYSSQFDSATEAVAYGDRCWSQVMSHHDEYMGKGLTGHRNWWPALYQAACGRWGVEPDAKAMSFNEGYGDRRADLKVI